MRESLPQAGDILAGHMLFRRIGEGGMGVVYESRDPEGQLAAVKVLRPRLADDPAVVEEFRNEARATAAVRHDSVVGIRRCGVEAGLHYMVMELVDGPPLESALRQVRRLSWKTSVRVAIHVARALGHAHEKGLLHRDVKPGNVLLTKDDRAKLIDFGIVKDISTLKGYLVNGRSRGTAAYASPEQCLGKRLSAATDIYSLGATLYHMVCGRPPFLGKTRTEVLTKHVKALARPPLEHAPEMPRALSKLIERMLAKKQADRPPSMQRVAHDLGLILEGKVAIADNGPRADFTALRGLKSRRTARQRRRA